MMWFLGGLIIGMVGGWFLRAKYGPVVKAAVDEVL